MNIEIANRLVELRKKNGLSQEELAAKLGLSRQAVSKWERAEASPDTDNLICLANLYGVSLDDLLKSDASADELFKEARDINEEKEEKEEKRSNERVIIGDDGIRVYDKDGTEKVIINDDKFIVDGKPLKYHMGKKAIDGIISSILWLAVAAVYLTLGFVIKDVNCWALLWPLFLMPIWVTSIIGCFRKRKITNFAMPVFITEVYCTLGMIGVTIPNMPNFWHPYWVLFFIIPLFYTIFAPIDKAIRRKSVSNGSIRIDSDDYEEVQEAAKRADRKANKAKARLDAAAKNYDEDPTPSNKAEYDMAKKDYEEALAKATHAKDRFANIIDGIVDEDDDD